MPRISSRWMLITAMLLVAGSCSSDRPEADEPLNDQAIAEPTTPLRNSVTVDTLPDSTNSIGMRFKLIPPGEFMMNSRALAGTTPDVERPRHRVQIPKPFFLGVTEVTQEEYVNVMGRADVAPSERDPFGDREEKYMDRLKPVAVNSWNDAVKFCRLLSAKEGRKYRLPTDAEWEYACRAGSTTRFCFGDDASVLAEHAWFKGNADDESHTVGKKHPNAWGLFDMHGNAWELCADKYGENLSANLHDGSWSELRVARGGGSGSSALYCRSESYLLIKPRLPRTSNLGFRVVLSADEPTMAREGAER